MKKKIEINKGYIESQTLTLDITMHEFWDMFFKDDAKFGFPDFFRESYEGSSGLDASRWSTSDIPKQPKDFQRKGDNFRRGWHSNQTAIKMRVVTALLPY